MDVIQPLASKAHRDIPIYLDQYLHAAVKEETELPTPKGQFPDQEEQVHGHPLPHLVTLGGGEKLPGFVSGSALSPPNTGDHLQQGTGPGTLHRHLQQDGPASAHNPNPPYLLTSESLISLWRNPYLNRPLPPPPPGRAGPSSSSNKPRTITALAGPSLSSFSSSTATSTTFPFPAATSRFDLVSSFYSSSSSSSSPTTQEDHFIIQTADTTYTAADITATSSYHSRPSTAPGGDAHIINAKGGTAASKGPSSHITNITPVTSFALPTGMYTIRTSASNSTLTMPERPSTSSGLTRKKSFVVSDYSTLSNSSSTTVATSSMSKAVKRLSKDDLFLVSKPSLISRFQSFRVPNTGRLPTPDPSPRSESPMSVEVPIAVRLHTPDSLHGLPGREGTMQHEEGIGLAVGSPIGMALGSPSHPPPPEAWENPWNSQPFVRQPSPKFQQQQEFQLPSTRPPVLSPASTDVVSPQPSQPKKGKWKMFGMFGSRKNKVNIKKGYEQQQIQQQVVGSSASIGPYATGAVPVRSHTIADRKAPKYKPIVVRSNTISDGSGSGSSIEAWNPPPVPQSSLQVPGMNSSTSTLRTTGGRMLDVDIPSVHMERYSIMFSNVLGPPQTNGQPQQPSQPGNASSLLARRHATLDRLKNINDHVEQKATESKGLVPQPFKVERKPIPAPAPAPIQTVRRATSPISQPTKSPAFSLFPSTPSSKPRNFNIQKEIPDNGNSRNRSNTAPSILPSPTEESFDLPALRKEATNNSQISLAIPNNTNLSPLSTRGRLNEFPPPRSSATRSQAPAATTTTMALASNERANASSLSLAGSVSKFTPNQSSLILDSPASMSSTTSEILDVVQTGPLKPIFNEPKWTILSAPPSNAPASTSASSAASVTSTTSTVTTSNRKRSPSESTSSVKTHVTQPSIVNIDEDDTALKAAVEISIARQISISRQQRNLLRPLKTNLVGGNGVRRFNTVAGTPSPGRSPATVVLENNEKLSETNTSTPVMVHPEDNLDVQVKGHQYKKSENIIIEGY